MFVVHNKVRMHDTDMAGILFFGSQFRFVQDALEDLMAEEGLSFQSLFAEGEYAFVVVHAEADYLLPIKVGDDLETHLFVEKIGNSSFIVSYTIYNEFKQEVGRAKTVHVTVDTKTRKKILVPIELRTILARYMRPF